METRSARIEMLAGIAVLALLVFGCLLVLRPFFAALLWALILSMTTWPAYRWIEARLGGRRTLAALVMTIILALALLLPFALAGPRLARNVGSFAEGARTLLEGGPPPPPDWVAEIPVAGQQLSSFWLEFSVDSDRLTDELAAYVPSVTKWVLGVLGNLGAGFLELLLSVLVAFFFYRDGLAAAQRLHHLIERIAGDRGEMLLKVASETIKGVVYGILGTAFAQGILTGFGLWMAGIPSAFFLGLLGCFVAILPGGAPLIWLPAAIWLFVEGGTAWGIFLLIWGVLVVGSIDNVLKPYFIGRGSPLPLLLVFLGVLGGAAAFGFLGVFLGPTLLAVGYTLLQAWGPAAEAGHADASGEAHKPT